MARISAFQLAACPRKMRSIKLIISIILVLPIVNMVFYAINDVIEGDTSVTWSQFQTRDVRKLIQPNKNTFKVAPKGTCDFRRKEAMLLIVVTSSMQNHKKRQVIRDTWGKDVLILKEEIRLIFLVGEQPDDMIANEKFMIEHEMFGDVLQGSFIDSYTNLTIKSLSMLKWFSDNCGKHVRYLMKVDDDVYVNLFELYNLVQENTKINMLTGFIHCGVRPMTHGKWYAPPYMLNGSIDGPTYPNYIAGPAYVMSNTTAEILYRISMLVPAFHLEDVFVTGILPQFYNKLLYKKDLNNTFLSLIFPNKETPIREMEIHPAGDGRFVINSRSVFTSLFLDPCLYINLISSELSDSQELSRIHKKITKLKEIANFRTKMCSKHIAEKLKRMKSCH